MDNTHETIADIIAEKRQYADDLERACNEIAAEAPSLVEKMEDYKHTTIADIRREADRLEAAHKRETDSIHRAMVILAGIEMPDAENPPSLYTALEDAYNALSDALGTDGDTTADEEAAKSTGRHFVIHPSGDVAKLREALVSVKKSIDEMGTASLVGDPEIMLMSLTQMCAGLSARIEAALASTEREGGNDEQK